MHKGKYHHGNLREALIDTAKLILAAQGVQGLSLRKVAQQTGVSATALYSHFKDKRELLAVLATLGFEQLSAYMEAEARKQDTSNSGESSLAGFARGYVVFSTNNAALFQLMFGREVGDPLDFPALVEAGDKTYSIMADCVALQLKQNNSTTSPTIAATAAWSMVHGLSTLINDKRVSANSCGVDSVEEMVRQVCQSLDFSD